MRFWYWFILLLFNAFIYNTSPNTISLVCIGFCIGMMFVDYFKKPKEKDKK